jgi:acyl-CoA thioester hydrolase
MKKSSPSPAGPAVDIAIRVRYAETDAQRVVYHGNYIVWFEVGRTEYCERAGYPYPRMEAEGIFITVTEAHVRYRRSTRYGDVVTVRTRFGEQKSRGCSFFYEILLPDGGLAAEGETQHLFLDATGRPRKVPPSIEAAFREFARLDER